MYNSILQAQNHGRYEIIEHTMDSNAVTEWTVDQNMSANRLTAAQITSKREENIMWFMIISPKKEANHKSFECANADEVSQNSPDFRV